MIKFKARLAFISAALIVTIMACQAEQSANKDFLPLPASMLGVWQVTSVLTDQGVKGEVQGLDDKYIAPKYHGRIFTFTPKVLAINTPRDDNCEEPRFSLQKSTANMLIANSISTRLYDNSRPTVEDLGLVLVGDASLDVFYLRCKGKLRAKDEGMSALADLSNVVWIVDIDKSQLAMSWHDQTVLILSKVPENAKPRASFDCAKAGALVEKTICNSIGLAAYDQSLAQTYKLVKNYYASMPDSKMLLAQLKASQKEWLRQRDTCGSDGDCLEKFMYIRIGDLIYDLGDYMYQNR